MIVTPYSSLIGAIFYVVEEGGEMATVSMIAWYVYRLTTNVNMYEKIGCTTKLGHKH
jgi:hypothetical protein